MKNEKYLVKENPNLYRDAHSKAIINNDFSALKEYKQKIKIAENMENNNEKISKIEDDLNQIKQLLDILIKKI